MLAPASIVSAPVRLILRLRVVVEFVSTCDRTAPVLIVRFVPVIEIALAFPVTVTFGAATTPKSVKTPGDVEPASVIALARIGSRLAMTAPFAGTKLSNRYTPCHLSPGLTERAGLHESSVTVLLTMAPAAVEIRHVPFRTF